ncbi:hypothetical protein GPECTOR_75g745 [Gonium pectorale]|uniref:Rad4 beta-hairpin domain-containing protein n=1 Tax=Gonium pectorale TaxID=33097 RepID=A0A150G2J7_GONPE|nr:hypothetical protein GPECTOR_75g745 [Gonium pectorale]|eukprot:KXZ44021.1 hypothetical protein GPECTOR_75g745 [Gonium pectorale]
MQANPQRHARRSITKKERDAAAALHRCHVLCLMARARLLDQAAQQPELQAILLSLLPPAAALRNQDAEEPQRAVNGLLPLVGWFRAEWAVLPPDAAWPAGRRDGGTAAGQDAVNEQLIRAATGRAGAVEILAALFVALVRGQGGSARLVRLLDAMPLAPWRARPRTVRTTAAPPAAAATAGGAGGGGSGRRRALDLDAGDVLPEEVSGRGRGGRGGGGGRGKGRKGASLEEVLAAREGGRGGGGSRGRGRAGGAAGRGGKKRKAAGDGGEEDGGASGGDGDGGANVAVRAQSSPAALGGGKRQRSEGAAQAAAAATRSKTNRGEDEFEVQLQMALLATQREAEARAAGGAGGAATAKQAGTAGGRAAAAGARGGTAGGSASADAGGAGGTAPAGSLLSLRRPDVVVSCWAEVYCGSAERGRWVAVDVANGYVDRPELIDTATHRPTPVCYVVAAERGGLADVTPRYCHNLLAAQRNRDEPWWAATAAALSMAGGAGVAVAAAATGAGKEENVGAERKTVEEAKAGGGSGGGAAAAATAAAAAINAVVAGKGGGGGGGSGGRAGPLLVDARLSHQRGEQDNPLGPHAARRKGAAAAPAGGAGEGSDAPAGAIASTVGAAAAAAANGGDLRAAREAAELAQRGLSQLAGLPTSIDGFKSHPMYVLKRHIGKYEALRPGTAPLGLHRGEPYFPRAQLSVLHTVERWRREGRQVRDSELGAPAKVAKKRAMPGAPRAGAPAAAAPAGGGSRRKPSGGSGRGRGGEEDDEEDLLEEIESGTVDAGALGPGAGPTINLYGRWQTDPWVPPAAADGIVPKNERGNVECPPLAPSLPLGTVHLTTGPGLGGLCRSLGVDFAPGLVGFEVQGGRMVPRIEGVVVCEEVAELVESAYLQREAARVEAAAARRRRAAEVAWRQLLGALRLRAQLERDYAGPGRDGGEGVEGTAEGEEGRAEARVPGGAVAAAAVAAAAKEAAAGGLGCRAAARRRGASAGGASAAQLTRQRLAAEAEATEAEAGAADTRADVEVEEF